MWRASAALVAQIASGPLDSVRFTEQHQRGRLRRRGDRTGIGNKVIPTPDSQALRDHRGPRRRQARFAERARQIGRAPDPSTGSRSTRSRRQGAPWSRSRPSRRARFRSPSRHQPIGRIDPATDQITAQGCRGGPCWGIVTVPTRSGSARSAADIGRLEPATGQISEFAGSRRPAPSGSRWAPTATLGLPENASAACSAVFGALGTSLISRPARLRPHWGCPTLTPIAGQPVTFTATVCSAAPGTARPQWYGHVLRRHDTLGTGSSTTSEERRRVIVSTTASLAVGSARRDGGLRAATMISPALGRFISTPVVSTVVVFSPPGYAVLKRAIMVNQN